MAVSRKPRARRRQDGPLTKPDLRGSMWNAHHILSTMPRLRGKTVGARLRLLEDEAAIKDLLNQYSYFYDGGDVDGVITVFGDNAVLINPRGTYIGKDAIRRNYAFLISLSKIVLHFIPNVTVRLTSEKEAWMVAYYYGVAATPDGTLNGTGGTYIDHLAKTKDGWKIAERRISWNFRHSLTPETPGGGAPEPTLAESSRDIIGPQFEM